MRSYTKLFTAYANVDASLDDWDDDEIMEYITELGLLTGGSNVIDEFEIAIRKGDRDAVFEIARRTVCDVKGIIL